MKKALFLLALLLLPAALPAEAPELRSVMPNSWRLITRLPPEEEAAFLRDYGGLVGETVRMARDTLEYPFYGSGYRPSGEPRVYLERVGGDAFYRLVIPDSARPDFSDQRGIVFVQSLVYERGGRMAVVGVAPYHSLGSSEPWHYRVWRSLDIVRAGGRARGILGTQVSCYRRDSGEYADMVKGQVRGFRNTAIYVLMEELDRALDRGAAPGRLLEEGIIPYEGMPVIKITASPCLVDPAVPLRYGLQNAFDGDPATSFVENTEGDTMSISLSGPNLVFGASGKRMAIINGYAQSMALYRSNNRVRTISTIINNAPVRMELLDDCLSWQFVEGDVGMSVVGIYPGGRYNDTCVAEFNVYTDGYGWLFGDVDE